jgi:hypothetical protein
MGGSLGLETITATNILTLCLVVVTALYCFFTYRILQANSEMVTQMRAQYESFIAPIITTTITIKHDAFLYLKVENRGQSPAKNLRLSLDKDFYRAAEFGDDHNIREYEMFNRVIPSFGPGEKLFIMLAQGFNLGKIVDSKEITPYQFTISATYKFGNKEITSTHEIDLKAYMHTSQDRSETLDELRKIRKAIEAR